MTHSLATLPAINYICPPPISSNMTAPLGKLAKATCIAIVVFTFLSAGAQYTVKNPAYSSRETETISIEAIRYYPDHIWIDLVYQDHINNEPGYRINSSTTVNLPWLEDMEFKLDNVSNVGYTDYKYVKKGSKNVFSLRFPFNIADIFENDDDYNLAVLRRMAASFPLKMDLVECTESYKKRTNTGGCFNITGINFGLTADQLSVLYCERVLQESLKKDEFETTATFQKRTHPDSLKKAVMVEIRAFEQVYMLSRLIAMSKTVPSINYDSDSELFTIQYTGVKSLRIKVPLDKARAFKENILARKLEIQKVEGERDINDMYTLSKLTFKDAAGKESSYINVDATSNATIQRATEERVYEELKKVYPTKGVLR